MIARKCYLCPATWEAEDGNTDILCPKCRAKPCPSFVPKPQRDLARLKEVVDA